MALVYHRAPSHSFAGCAKPAKELAVVQRLREPTLRSGNARLLSGRVAVSAAVQQHAREVVPKNTYGVDVPIPQVGIQEDATRLVGNTPMVRRTTSLRQIPLHTSSPTEPRKRGPPKAHDPPKTPPCSANHSSVDDLCVCHAGVLELRQQRLCSAHSVQAGEP